MERLAVLARSLWTKPARQAQVFLASRAVNGALALLQVLLVTRAVGPSEAGRYFALWTGAWLLSVVLRFGADGILPRAVAEAGLAGTRIVSIRPVLRTGLAAGLVVLPILLLALGLPLGPAAFALALGLGLVCAAIWTIASLLKAHGRADLAGLVSNVFWPLGSTLAPLPLLGSGGTWEGLAALTLVLWAVALAASGVVAVRALGAPALRGVVRSGGWSVPVKRDEVGAAILTSLYEVMGWLPVILAALVGLEPAAAAGVFAATRVAGPFSWGYQAIVAVLVPRIATGFARGDAQALRRTLVRGSVAGAIVTWPLCAAGIVLAEPLLSVLDSSYGEFADILVLLIAARAVDAATGPLGEALLVGRRTWLDAAIVSTGITAGIATALALHGPLGDLAIGVGAAGAFVMVNLVRALALRRMVRDGGSLSSSVGVAVLPETAAPFGGSVYKERDGG